jgi:hypothetical protein
MLAISVLALSTLMGLSGKPIWAALACGLLLAMIGLSERLPVLRRAHAISGSTVAISASASLMLAQIASVGTFAVGRLIGVVLLA